MQILPDRHTIEAELASQVQSIVQLDISDGGSHSTVYRLETDRGPCILRLPIGEQGFYTAYLPADVPRQRWFNQRWALNATRRARLPVPQLLVSHTTPPPAYVIMNELPGSPICDYERWPIQPGRAHRCPYDEAHFGAMLRTLHAIQPTGYGPIDDKGRTYFTTWSRWLLQVAQTAICRAAQRAGISRATASALERRWLPSLEQLTLDRPYLLHMESLGFANLLYDPQSRRITGLLDLEDCIGGDPLFELVWMTYYYGQPDSDQRFFDYARFQVGYGPWPGSERTALLYRPFAYIQKLTWIPLGTDRAAHHQRALRALARHM